ncbi:hypothetical protein VMCG_03293 [Cytospora schulzeri]|uniref:Uncharacterized protein n=1 Tax=Cytospora schulzeri TaxID=448051 RepID=A0A423WY35_9PEZI|nr:hypothetical protein VMCG_03293 [Valsa malicola]
MANHHNNNGTSSSSLEAWFPVTKGDWGLDAVTLLAVIGESSISDHSQPVTASVLCLLPRILPAPQALLKPTRPSRLPDYGAKMAGVHSGVVSDSVGFFANIIHPLEEQRPFSFKVLEVKHREVADDLSGEVETPPSRRGSWLAAGRLWRPSRSRLRRPPSVDDDDIEAKNGTPLSPSSPPLAAAQRTVTFAAPGPAEKGVFRPRQGQREGLQVEEEEGNAEPEPAPAMGIKRRRTAKEKVTDFIANPTLTPVARPAVPPAWSSPIHIVTVSSFVMTLVIFGMTAYWRDGNALLAIFIISMQSSLVGYASWWKPRLMVRPPHTTDVPPGDMMIRTKEGAFILVKCTEEVTRELYGAGTECEYHVGDRTYRFLMAMGTMLLMVGVVLLGNVKFNAQALIAGSYIVLNGAYWLLGMLPRRYFWDLSRYEWEDVTPPDARDADKLNYDPASGVEGYPSFTRTLWYAIRETGQTGWVERSGAAPGTALWRQWLEEAGENAREGNRRWTAVRRKDEIMREGMNKPVSPGQHRTDTAEQHAPLDEVKLRSSPAPVANSQF